MNWLDGEEETEVAESAPLLDVMSDTPDDELPDPIVAGNPNMSRLAKLFAPAC
jgi:hypothetical protein